MIVIFQTKYDKHSKKRPTLTFEFNSSEELMLRLMTQIDSTLDDYDIIISSGFMCKNCRMELDYELYSYNRLCNRCDEEFKAKGLI